MIEINTNLKQHFARLQEDQTHLDPNLEPPKDLNLMFRDQLGVGDEVTG
jgi:hypothetical protein